MRLIIKNNSHDFDKQAADEIVNQIKKKADSVIGFATGNTTVGLHEELVNRYQEESVDFSNVTTFNLDEYVGVSKEDPTSCYSRMENQLFKYVNLKVENIKCLDGMATSLDMEAENYEILLRKVGGIDIQVLGIGTNGHIAFNEPGSPFGSVSRIVDIANQTVKGKASLFGSLERVPRQGITMGIKSIMKAKRILLLAKGEQKASIIFKTLNGPVTTDVPASILQLHPNVTVILDQDAAKDIVHEPTQV
jgi:glucosamine-6-phosphate deaminase